MTMTINITREELERLIDERVDARLAARERPSPKRPPLAGPELELLRSRLRLRHSADLDHRLLAIGELHASSCELQPSQLDDDDAEWLASALRDHDLGDAFPREAWAPIIKRATRR